VSLATKGVVAISDDTLTRVTRPILAFDSAFDAILLGRSVWVLNQKNFEGLFRESEAVLARTPEWVDHLNQVLPISAESKNWLVETLRQNSVMRRKVQSILHSAYLPKLTPDTVRAKMAGHGLAVEDLMRDGSLVFNKDTERDLLLFLNEDLWTGDFSADQYATARKARRPVSSGARRHLRHCEGWSRGRSDVSADSRRSARADRVWPASTGSTAAHRDRATRSL
jgi:hypothetical protein